MCQSPLLSGSALIADGNRLTVPFDANGNRTRTIDQANANTTLAYDAANRLTNFNGAAAFGYNGDGVRMTKASGGAVTAFVWNLVTGPPTIIQDGITAYVTGLGNVPLEQISGSAVYWYHEDQLGSTRLLTDATGTVQQTYTYDAYGNLESGTGSLLNPFRFAGQYFDSETGFYYLRARFYDPATVQFITKDPAIGKTLQAYIYVDDSPLNRTDLTGLWPDPRRMVSDLWRWANTPTMLPNDKLIAGAFNVVYGAIKIGYGVELIAGGGLATVSIPFIGEIGGPAVVAWGAYQVVSGGARARRGVGQLAEAETHPRVCKSPLRWATDIASEVTPGRRVDDFIAGLP